MGRVLLLVAALALAVAAVVSGSAASVAHVAATPRLLLSDTDPVTFRGVGFKAGEYVRLNVDAGKREVRRAATASQSGRFTMRVSGVDPNACEGFSATAIGNRGSRATFKRAPGECPSP